MDGSEGDSNFMHRYPITRGSRTVNAFLELLAIGFSVSRAQERNRHGITLLKTFSKMYHKIHSLDLWASQSSVPSAQLPACENIHLLDVVGTTSWPTAQQ